MFEVISNFGYFDSSFSVYLAKTSADEKNVSKIPKSSGNLSLRPQIISERSGQSSTRDNSHHSGLPKRVSTLPTGSINRHLSSSQNDYSQVDTASSKLPLKRGSVPKHFTKRTVNAKEIATNIEAQSSKLKLTSEEREALISRILTNELELQSKLNAQAMELFSSPNSDDIRKNDALSNPGYREQDSRRTSPLEKRFATEVQGGFLKTVTAPTPDKKNQIVVQTDRSRPKTIRSTRPRRSKYGAVRSLTPIPEAR